MAVDFNPMNMQMIMPRANDATQVQHQMNQQVNVQQEVQQMRQKTEDQQKLQQVRGKEEAQGGRIDNDPDDERRRGGYQGRKKDDDEAEDGTFELKDNSRPSLDSVRGQHIDISF